MQRAPGSFYDVFARSKAEASVSTPKFRVSILLLTYRMERTIVQALEGAIAQTIPCEIIVSDDASDDRGFDLAAGRAAVYSGQHRLVLRRNESNEGLCRHIDTVSRIATGDILVLMSGDDVSYPDRVKKLLEVFDAHPDAYAVGSAVDEIDGEGNVMRRGAWFLDSPMDQRKFLRGGRLVALLGASLALRRQILDELPPLRGMVEDHMLTLAPRCWVGPTVSGSRWSGIVATRAIWASGYSYARGRAELRVVSVTSEPYKCTVRSPTTMLIASRRCESCRPNGAGSVS